MTGTIINFLAALAGGLLGCLLKKGVPERVKDSVMKAEGLAIALIGLSGALGAMFTVEGAGLRDSGGLLLLVSLVAGCFLGELLRLDDRLTGFGAFMERKLGAKGFSRGLVTASLVFCAGTMSILGPFNEVLRGDRGVLYIKSTLDFVTGTVLASTLGIGVVFAAVPVLLIQGAFALAAGALEPYMTAELLRAFSMTGYAIVLCIGLNFLVGARIKTMNLVPALLVAVLYQIFIGL